MSEHRLWGANPHQFGPGKIHIVDIDDETKTFCGRYLSAIPGAWSGAKQATCRICLDAVVRRPVQKQWAREAEVRRAELEQKRAAENAVWWATYNTYLQSDEWKVRRSKVMERARFLCEGCLAAPASQVHHLTYAHVGAEFLWELRAVCVACHERLHETRQS